MAKISTPTSSPSGSYAPEDDGKVLTVQADGSVAPESGTSGAGAIAHKIWDPASDNDVSFTSATYADIAASGLTIPDFEVPESGAVVVELSMWAAINPGASTNILGVNLRDGSGDIAGTDQRVFAVATSDATQYARIKAVIPVTGLTPAATMTGWRPGAARLVGSGTVTLSAGPLAGPATVEVRALPL